MILKKGIAPNTVAPNQEEVSLWELKRGQYKKFYRDS
jgi:hypothetical protein